ncbi:mannose-6-phosphate isomerase, class I [Candidatus Riflebacteria bacterium]
MQQILLLRPQIAEYDWGGISAKDGSAAFLRNFLDLKPSTKPAAEIWYGAHPSLPAKVLVKDREFPLDSLIEANPDKILGPKLIERGYKTLPFLFKISDALQSLSIQAHPDAPQAKILHQQFPERYPDPNGKEEFWFAIDDDGLDAFAGFKNPDLLLQNKKLVDKIPFFSKNLEKLQSTQISQQAFMKGLLEALMQIQPQIRDLLLPHLLNRVHLEKEEGIFIPPRTPHAIIKGRYAEIQVNSDNTVRAGMTTKFVDIPVLLDILDFKSGLPPVIKPIMVIKELEYSYPLNTINFSLSHIKLQKGDELIQDTKGITPHLLVSFAGECEIITKNKVFSGLKRGQAILLQADFKTYNIRSKTENLCLIKSFMP